MFHGKQLASLSEEGERGGASLFHPLRARRGDEAFGWGSLVSREPGRLSAPQRVSVHSAVEGIFSCAIFLHQGVKDTFMSDMKVP